MAEFDTNNKVKEWLQAYIRLSQQGQVGKFLSEELFLTRYTEQQIAEGYRDGLTLLDWCVVRALESLETVSDEDAIFNIVQAAAKKAADTGEREDLQRYLNLRGVINKVSISDFKNES